LKYIVTFLIENEMSMVFCHW